MLALFAKGPAQFDPRVLMTLATVDDLLAIILIAVFFSSINAWYWFHRHRRMRRHLGMYLVRLKKVPWIAVGIVGVLAWIMMFGRAYRPHFGRRAGWPAGSPP